MQYLNDERVDVLIGMQQVDAENSTVQRYDTCADICTQSDEH